MTHRLILTLCASVLMLFGLALALAPDAVVALYKAQALTASGRYYSMLLGGTFIAVAIVNWAASRAPARADAAYVVLADLLISCAGFAIALDRQLSDAATPSANWFNVALYLGFAGLFAYLQFGAMEDGSPRRATVDGQAPSSK